MPLVGASGSTADDVVVLQRSKQQCSTVSARSSDGACAQPVAQGALDPRLGD